MRASRAVRPASASVRERRQAVLRNLGERERLESLVQQGLSLNRAVAARTDAAVSAALKPTAVIIPTPTTTTSVAIVHSRRFERRRSALRSLAAPSCRSAAPRAIPTTPHLHRAESRSCRDSPADLGRVVHSMLNFHLEWGGSSNRSRPAGVAPRTSTGVPARRYPGATSPGGASCRKRGSKSVGRYGARCFCQGSS